MEEKSFENLRLVLDWRGKDIVPEPQAIERRYAGYAEPSPRNPVLSDLLRSFASISYCWERSQVQDHNVIALGAPRRVYAGAQGLAEALGCHLQYESGEHWWALPALQSPNEIAHLTVRKDWRQCGFIRQGFESLAYLRESLLGQYPLTQMVTGSVLEMASFVLGYQTMLESLYSHPREIHLLNRMIVELLVEYINACRAAAGNLLSDHVATGENGYTLCSEIRAVISPEMYAEFEEPYLEQIAQAVGPLNIHSCGEWSRTLPVMIRSGAFKAIEFGLPEMNWPNAAKTIGDQFWIQTHRSINCPCAFIGPEQYYEHLFRYLHPDNRLILVLAAMETNAYNCVYRKLESEQCLPEQMRHLGEIALPAWALANHG